MEATAPAPLPAGPRAGTASVADPGRAPAGDRIFHAALTSAPRSRSRCCWSFWPSSSTRAPARRSSKFGLGFVIHSTWDPVAEKFGALPLIFGTLFSSLLALLIAVPLSLGVAIFLTEFCPKAHAQPVASCHRAAGRDPQRGLRPVGHLRADPAAPATRLPVPARGPRLPAVLPGRDLRAVGARGQHHPGDHGHAVHHVGRRARCCSRCPTASARPRSRSAPPAGRRCRTAIVPYARSGIIGAVILGLGRALGETMAVTMLIGNRHEISASLFAPGLHHGGGDRQRVLRGGDRRCTIAALAYVALLLFVITVAGQRRAPGS